MHDLRCRVVGVVSHDIIFNLNALKTFCMRSLRPPMILLLRSRRFKLRFVSRACMMTTVSVVDICFGTA